MNRWWPWMCVALCGAACQPSWTCSKGVDCPSGNGASFSLCTTGDPNDCEYRSSSGSEFRCHSCSDCSGARSLADAWCITAPPPGGTSGETCSAPQSCPLGSTNSGTYRACTAAQGKSCRFSTSDGKTFSCASCADCAAATTQVNTWCGSGFTPFDLAGGRADFSVALLNCGDLITCTNPVSGGGMCPDGQNCDTSCKSKASSRASTLFDAVTNCIIAQCGALDGATAFQACELRVQCSGVAGMDFPGCNGMPKGACNDAITACSNDM